MITINLYDYKTVIRDVGIQKNVVKVVGVTVLSVALCFVIWVFQWFAQGIVEGDLAEVNAKVVAATPDYNAVQQLKKQQDQYQKIITGIDKLRSNQTRTTEFLEDMGQAVPEGVWLRSIMQLGISQIESKKVPFLFISSNSSKSRRSRKKANQKKNEGGDKFIELKGVGMNDQAIIHFLEQLRALSYIDAVVLHSSKREWVENQPVKRFEIYCHFLKTEPAA